MQEKVQSKAGRFRGTCKTKSNRGRAEWAGGSACPTKPHMQEKVQSKAGRFRLPHNLTSALAGFHFARMIGGRIGAGSGGLRGVGRVELTQNAVLDPMLIPPFARVDLHPVHLHAEVD